ncbi:hypothetical protein ACTA71_005749 [Dictyostelium dimigraforme]
MNNKNSNSKSKSNNNSNNINSNSILTSTNSPPTIMKRFSRSTIKNLQGKIEDDESVSEDSEDESDCSQPKKIQMEMEHKGKLADMLSGSVSSLKYLANVDKSSSAREAIIDIINTFSNQVKKKI